MSRGTRARRARRAFGMKQSRLVLMLRYLAVSLTALLAAHPALAQDALRGKLLYHDIGRINGAGVSCVDCHGGVPGALHGLGKVANNPSAIAYALGAVSQMTPLRGRVSVQDMADIAAYVAFPSVASPTAHLTTSGPAASPFTSERLEFPVVAAGTASPPSSVRLTNTGTVALRLATAPVLAGPEAAQFSIASSDCATGMILAAQQSCAVEIAFHPQGRAGLRAASLRIAHDWIGAGTSVALIGRVVAP